MGGLLRLLWIDTVSFFRMPEILEAFSFCKGHAKLRVTGILLISYLWQILREGIYLKYSIAPRLRQGRRSLFQQGKNQRAFRNDDDFSAVAQNGKGFLQAFFDGGDRRNHHIADHAVVQAGNQIYVLL